MGGVMKAGWNKSNYSNGSSGSNRVEVAPVHDGITGALEYVAVRDSKNPNHAMLLFTPEEWTAFIAGVKGGQFDA